MTSRPILDSDNENPTINYSNILRLQKALEAEECVWLVHDWHRTLVWPPSLSNSEYATFLQYCTEFLIAANKLWRKDTHGRHKIVAAPSSWIAILTAAHNNIAPCYFFRNEPIKGSVKERDQSQEYLQNLKHFEKVL